MRFRKATHSYNELKSYMMANKLRVSINLKLKFYYILYNCEYYDKN